VAARGPPGRRVTMLTAAPIYLDYNATTPIDPAVNDAMEPFLQQHFGNPSSTHPYGRTASDALASARRQVASLLGADDIEIVFTGSGSEANNLALKGLVFRALATGPAEDLQIVTSAIEHPALAETCRFLERRGCRITTLPVDECGVVDVDALRAALRRRTLVVSVMHANNEVGTIAPIREIADLAHEHGALVHTDAAQSVGKIGVDVDELGVDLLTVAGHKLYAPKGIGALYVRRGVELEPLVHGGGQEGSRRAGTENVPYAAGLGAACEIAQRRLPAATPRLAALSERLWRGLEGALGDRVVLNGHPHERLPNTLNVSFLGAVGADLLARTPEIAASTGSACHEGDAGSSSVLDAMGVPPERSRAAIRLSVGRLTTPEEIDTTTDLLASRAGTAHQSVAHA
jgi:cysteine desulfurase